MGAGEKRLQPPPFRRRASRIGWRASRSEEDFASGVSKTARLMTRLCCASVSSCSRVEEPNNIALGPRFALLTARFDSPCNWHGCELWLSTAKHKTTMAKLLLVLAALSHALVPTPTARHPTKLHSTKQDNVVETAGRAGLMSAATVAAAAVNQAVSMTTLDAPDVGRILRGIEG